MSLVLLLYYEQTGDLLHRVINILDGAVKDDLSGIRQDIVSLLQMKCKKERIPILTEAERYRILHKSKSMKVERLPALLLVNRDVIVKIVYLEDEFDIATKL